MQHRLVQPLCSWGQVSAVLAPFLSVGFLLSFFIQAQHYNFFFPSEHFSSLPSGYIALEQKSLCPFISCVSDLGVLLFQLLISLRLCNRVLSVLPCLPLQRSLPSSSWVLHLTTFSQDEALFKWLSYGQL